MFTISKRFGFSASHQLAGLPDGHPCARLHGHNYVVEVELAGDLDGVGFVADYGALAPFQRWLDTTVDHRHLNDLLDGNPTAERLARWFHQAAAEQLPGLPLAGVGVSETPKTWAWWRP